MSSRRSSSSSSSRPDSPALFSAFAQAHSHSQQQLQLRPPHQAQASQPQQPPPPPRNQKADHILQNFYVKVIQIVVLARVTHPDPSAAVSRKGSLRGAPLVRKTSKWFNLELEDLDIYKEDAKFWRAMAITESPPAMLVELLLDTSELAPNQMLMVVDESNRRKRVEIGPSSTGTTPLGQSRSRRNIILESWSLTQSNTPPDPAPEPPVVYKKSIIFFRSLYAYMRLLPAYQLYKRLRKQNLPLKIGFRVSRGQAPEESMFRDSDIGIEVPLIEGETRPNLSEYRFGQVETPLGAFSLKVTYRSNCEFHVDESEASMIYRFNDMDENYFTPTIVTHSQESVKSSGRPSFDGRRPTAPSPLPRRSSNDLYNSGNYQDQFAPLQTLGHRRSSIQSFQQRSGEYSSSQSSVSSLGARGTRRESSGGPGSLFTSVDAQNPGSTPPFSTHGGNATGSRTGVDAILESPPLKLGAGSQRPLSSNFSPFKTPSLSSSPSPSYLEPASSSLSSRPPSIKMGRSPSTSSMSRVQSSQLGSGLLSSTQRTGSATPTQSAGLSNLQSGGTAMLSSSVKSNASSSTSAPRVASIFSHRHDGRRSSSESLPGGRNRSSIIGASSLFQFTPDDDDVSSFVRMLDSPEPLKMFGKTSGSTIGPSFGFGESSLTSSALKTKSTLDRFQQLKQVNADLSDSMSASQILSKEQGQQSSSHSRPSGSSNLTITTGHLSRRATLSDIGTTSPTGTAIPLAISRHSQSLSHQPGTPSPLHSEVPLYPLTSSGQTRPSSSSVHQHASGHSRTGSTPTKRFSWLLGADGSHGKGSSMGSIAFRHGSLDQGKDIFGMDEAMGRVGISSPTEVAFGSFPEDVHHQQSRYSAPLKTGRETTFEHNVASGADPRPIPSSAHSGESSSSRPSGRLLRLGSGSSGASFTLPRLRSRAGDDNESLSEVASVSNARGHQHGERNEDQFECDDEGEEDEEDDDQDDSRSEERRSSQEEKREHNSSLNDDDDMLFIMSELSPGSTPATRYQSFSTGVNVVYPGAGGTAAFLPSSAPTERGMMPLTGAMMNLRSQSQSPAMGPHGSPYNPSSGNGGPASTSSSPHYRLFGRNAPMSGSVFSNNGNNGNSSRSNSVSHSRGGSNSGSNTNGQNSVENLHLLRRSFSGSGIEDGPGLSPSMTANLRLGAAPPLLPPLPPAVTPGATSYPYDSSILEGRRMSRTGSDRGVPTSGVHSRRTSASGVNSNGHNSFHSDHRSGQREGW